ncbi:hypothetical protein [Orrella marina]|uniref:hypothetical protein n=1 Tax=Orrella marina TaxID=2163011 RepID=UPI00131EF146|nr:hypothetical protein [Orrella marina]
MRGFLACAPSLGTLLWVQVPLLTRHPGGDRSSDPAGTVAGIAAADTGSGLQQTQLRIPTWRSAVQSMQQVVDWLRAIKLTQCKRGTTMYQDLIAMGASPVHGRGIAANFRLWWRNSAKSLNGILTIA